MAYLAPADLDTPFHIAVLVNPPPKVIDRDGFRYQLEGPTP